MTKTLSAFLLLISTSLKLTASVWYAAPNALAIGNGSLTNPWPLAMALVQTGISPGDTLYLRGGTYQGPGFISTLSGTSNNYITVQSAPGEWAVIADGARGTLLTPMSGFVSNTIITVAGSELWSDLVNLWIDGDILYVLSKSGTNWTVIPGWSGSTPAPHAVNSVVQIGRGLLIQNGSYVAFRDFELTCLSSMNRTNSTSHFIPTGITLDGKGNKLQGLIVHDVGGSPIGPYQQGDGGEVNGCIIYGNGYVDFVNQAGVFSGSAIYAQNASGRFQIKNCINFRNFTSGGKVFGETGPVKDAYIVNNIVFNNGTAGIGAYSGSTATSNVWINGNFLLNHRPDLAYVSRSNSAQYCINNVIVNGSFGTLNHIASVYTNNTSFTTENIGVGQNSFSFNNQDCYRSNLTIVWDYNKYYMGTSTIPYSQYQFSFLCADVTNSHNSAGGGYQKYTNDAGCSWQDWSGGWDLHSTYAEVWPSNYLNVASFSLDFNTNRHYVVVVSTSKQTNSVLDLITNGFSVGETYQLRDAQNYFNVVQSGTYTGTPINLPLNLTNVADISGLTPGDTVTNKHTNVDSPGLFNVFVLTKVASQGLLPPTDVHVVPGP